MTELVVIQGVAIALLGLLVVGLLRSHAEILRRLHELGVDLGTTEPAPVALSHPDEAAAPAHDIIGATPTGEAAAVGVRGASHSTLLAFLSSGCRTCAGFWRGFAGSAERLGLPPGIRPLIVTKGPDAESLSAVRDLAPAGVTVVMSTDAWLDYEVPGSPHFVLVDGPRAVVVAEGPAETWDEVRALLPAGTSPPAPSRRGRASDPDRRELVDAELLAAGIGPGHPSLYQEDPDEA